MLHRIARFGSPAFLGIALLVFLLPFLAVSCDVPGGYGRMTPGGTTTYSGLSLALGTPPSINEGHLRPADEQQPDELGVQLFVLLAAAGVAAALALAAARRWWPVAGIATAAAVSLIIGELLARSSLVDRVATQAALPFPDGKSAGDYVVIGNGFWLALALTLVGTGLSIGAARTEAKRDTPQD